MVLKARLVLTLMCAAAAIEFYITRINLSLAIIKMIQIVSSEEAQREPNREPFCMKNKNFGVNSSTQGFIERNIRSEKILNKNEILKNMKEEAPITLTTTERGYILSAFFYSYGLGCVIGGLAVDKIGAKKMIGAIVLVDIFGNFLIPIATKTHYGLLISIRVMLGLFQGAGYPSLSYLASVWIPKDEMARYLSIVYPANCLSPLIIFNLGAHAMNEFGWESVFYLSGFIGSIFLFLWTFLIYNSPEEHPSISVEEKNYILDNRLRTQTKMKKPPYKRMSKSIPLWANICANNANMIGFTILLTQLPIYFNSVIGINLKKNGLLSSLPFLSRFVSANVVGWSLSFISKKIKWSDKTWQRILTALGFWCEGVCMLLVSYVGCNGTAAVIFFILGTAFKGFSPAGYSNNLIAISPMVAGTAEGMSNCFAFSFSILGPIIVGALTPNETLSEWRRVFWFMFFIYLAGSAIYMIFVSDKVQPYNFEEKENEVAEVTENLKLMENNLDLTENTKEQMIKV